MTLASSCGFPHCIRYSLGTTKRLEKLYLFQWLLLELLLLGCVSGAPDGSFSVPALTSHHSSLERATDCARPPPLPPGGPCGVTWTHYFKGFLDYW